MLCVLRNPLSLSVPWFFQGTAFLLQLRTRPPDCCLLALEEFLIPRPLQEASILITHKEVLVFPLSSRQLPPCHGGCWPEAHQNRVRPDPSQCWHTAGPWFFACLSLPSVEVSAPRTQIPVAVVFQETAQAKGRRGAVQSLDFTDVTSNPDLTMCPWVP